MRECGQSPLAEMPLDFLLQGLDKQLWDDCSLYAGGWAFAAMLGQGSRLLPRLLASAHQIYKDGILKMRLRSLT